MKFGRSFAITTPLPRRKSAKRDIRSHRRRIAEYVERIERRVLVKVEMDAAFFRLALEQRVPGCDDVHLMAVRRDGGCYGLHESTDAVPGETWVRTGHHHDHVAHHDRRRRRRKRQGTMSDSASTLPETLDCPWRRSTKMIGTSPMRQPRVAASYSISTRKA